MAQHARECIPGYPGIWRWMACLHPPDSNVQLRTISIEWLLILTLRINVSRKLFPLPGMKGCHCDRKLKETIFDNQHPYGTRGMSIKVLTMSVQSKQSQPLSVFGDA